MNNSFLCICRDSVQENRNWTSIIINSIGQQKQLQSMNNYEILGVIGQGAYGIVLKARSNQTSKLVAIKKFKESDEDEMIRRIILRQIKVLKSLRNRNVVELLQAFKKKGIYYLVFEYLDNNMLEILERGRNGLEKPILAKYIFQVLRGLRFMHAKNYLHRDIKPQNLLINEKHVLKLCDMGFARNYPLPKDLKKEKLTEYVATRWYRSPELLLGLKYGFPIDIWATGCIIAELADGNPLLPGEDEIDQIKLIESLFAVKFRSTERIKLDPSQMYISKGNPSVHQNQALSTFTKKFQYKIGEMGVNLLRRMLELNPEKRITAEDALKHPFFDCIRDEYPESNEDQGYFNGQCRTLGKLGCTEGTTNPLKIQYHLKSKVHDRNSSQLSSLSKWDRKLSKKTNQYELENKRESQSLNENIEGSLASTAMADRTNRTDTNYFSRGFFRLKNHNSYLGANLGSQHERLNSREMLVQHNPNLNVNINVNVINNGQSNSSQILLKSKAKSKENSHRSYKTYYNHGLPLSHFEKPIKSTTNEERIRGKEFDYYSDDVAQGLFRRTKLEKSHRDKLGSKPGGKAKLNRDYFTGINRIYGNLKSKYYQKTNPSSNSLEFDQINGHNSSSVLIGKTLTNRLKNFRTKLGF